MKNLLAVYMGSESSLKASAWHELGEAAQPGQQPGSGSLHDLTPVNLLAPMPTGAALRPRLLAPALV